MLPNSLLLTVNGNKWDQRSVFNSNCYNYNNGRSVSVSESSLSSPA